MSASGRVVAAGVATLAACAAFAGASPPSTAAPPPAAHGVTGDPVHGATVYQICMGCHSLDEDDVGPSHRGVVGRRAGSVTGYAYSPALRASGLVWTPEALERWLDDPQTLVPGSRMFFALKNPQDRADVIAWLAQQR